MRKTHPKGKPVVRQNATQRCDKPLVLVALVSAVGGVLVGDAEQLVLHGGPTGTPERRFEVFGELALVVQVPDICVSAAVKDLMTHGGRFRGAECAWRGRPPRGTR